MANFDPVTMAADAGGNFLSGIADRAASELGDALFGPSDRISHERFMENEQRADWDNERQIGRDNAYLAGVTPGRAEAYNQMQDATYGEDIRRKTEGIQSMAKSLGMSPWEITGTGSASSPVQPGQNSQGANSQQFMAGMVPLQIAKMNNETQLKTTAMNNRTQLELNAQSTNEGKLPKQQTIESAARSVLTNAQSQSTWQNITLDQVRLLLQISPQETVDLPGYKRTAPAGGKALRNLMGSLDTSDKGDMPITAAIAGLNTDVAEQIMKEVKEVARGALHASKPLVEGTAQFLNAIGNSIGNGGRKYDEKHPR